MTTTRLTITPAEYACLKPTLDLLANRLASAKLGSFPHRHPWHNIDFQRSSVHRNRAFDEEMCAKIISAREKLWNLEASRKVRLDSLEIAALAFALRIALSSGKLPRGNGDAAFLATKLEKYRKRAKTAAIGIVGHVVYRASVAKWPLFLGWCRYNLLYSRIPNSSIPLRKVLWANQRAELAQMIVNVLEKRHFDTLTEQQMKRMVKLLKEEFRRGRRVMTLRELLRNEQGTGDALLFPLIKKKIELVPQPGADLPISIVKSAIGERFLAAKARLKTQTTAPTQNATAVRPPNPAAHQTSASSAGPDRPTHVPEPDRAITDADLTEAVASWLENDVKREYRLAVVNRAVGEALSSPSIHICLPETRVLADLIVETRPPAGRWRTYQTSGLVGYFAEWVLKWLYAYRHYPTHAAQILAEGYQLSVRRDALATGAL